MFKCVIIIIIITIINNYIDKKFQKGFWPKCDDDNSGKYFNCLQGSTNFTKNEISDEWLSDKRNQLTDKEDGLVFDCENMRDEYFTRPVGSNAIELSVKTEKRPEWQRGPAVNGCSSGGRQGSEKEKVENELYRASQGNTISFWKLFYSFIPFFLFL